MLASNSPLHGLAYWSLPYQVSTQGLIHQRDQKAAHYLVVHAQHEQLKQSHNSLHKAGSVHQPQIWEASGESGLVIIQ